MVNNGVRPVPVQEESLNSGVQTNPHSRRTSKQWGSAIPVQESFNSRVRPIPVQEESLNSGVRVNPRSRRITQQLGSGQSLF